MDLHHFRASVTVYVGTVSSFISMKERSASLCFVFCLGQWMLMKGIFPLAATPGWHYSSTKQNSFVCLCGCGWVMLTQATHRAAVGIGFFAAFTGRSRKRAFVTQEFILWGSLKYIFIFVLSTSTNIHLEFRSYIDEFCPSLKELYENLADIVREGMLY